jgi:drug/metabolite transporter (DMT)-like permease
MLYLTIALTVLSNVVYHVAQRSVPRSVHPLTSLMVNYLVALAATAALWPFFAPRAPLAAQLRGFNWASAAVGLSIVGVELGFLLAYRAGLNVSLASVTTGSLLAVLLLPIGVFFFRERLSPLNLVGIVFCVVGVILVGRK